MRKIVLIGLCGVSAAALFAGGVAYASNQGSGDAQKTHAAPRQITPQAAIDTTTETKFISIAPCRAVDTRVVGGDLINHETRTFRVGGTGFTGQGGPSAGCGLPTNPVAISATLTTVARHNGFLFAWAHGATRPATSFMNYGTTFNASTGGVIPVSSTGLIDVSNTGGPSDVIVDITGYYVKPLYAVVGSSGTLLTASRALSADQPFGTGTYEVVFDRVVSNCAYGLTAEGVPSQIGFAEPRSGNDHAVYVQFGGGTTQNIQFRLTVTC